jgi:NADH-quinone oxidoreductase subunit L
VGPARGFSWLCGFFDQHIVDGLVDLVGWSPTAVGGVFRPWQNGLVQYYALAMTLGLVVFAVAVVIRLSG